MSTFPVAAQVYYSTSPFNSEKLDILQCRVAVIAHWRGGLHALLGLRSFLPHDRYTLRVASHCHAMSSDKAEAITIGDRLWIHPLLVGLLSTIQLHVTIAADN